MFLTHAHVCVHTLYYDYPLKRSQNNICIYIAYMHACKERGTYYIP